MSEITVGPQAQTFHYTKPEFEKGKHFIRLARTDRMYANIQVIKQGGENNLHSHKHLDGFWFVLKGRARFYGEGDAVVADLGPHEGVLIPRNFAYWFESAGEEDLELLQVEAFDVALPDMAAIRADRVNHTPLKESYHTRGISEAEQK